MQTQLRNTAILCALGLVALLWGSCTRHPDYILIYGSETVLPLAWKLADRFTELDTMPDLSAIGGGSGAGIAALLADSTDIAMSSRAIKPEERKHIAQQGRQLEEFPVGRDGLAIIVHKDNPLDSLQPEQVKAIFSGALTEWRELGADLGRIQALHRDVTSGTYDFFSTVVLQEHKPAQLPVVGMNEQLLDVVMSAPTSIAYIGIAYVDTALVKPLYIVSATGKAIAPTPASIQDGSYPWIRTLYFYHTQPENRKIRKTLDYLRTADGQRLIERVGYLPAHTSTPQ